MTTNFIAALTALTILASGAAYAGNVPAPAMTPGVVSQAIAGVAGGESYPQFSGPARPITSSAPVAVNGEQYPQFSGASSSLKAQRMIAANGQDYPSFAAPSASGNQGSAYAQAAQSQFQASVPYQGVKRAS